MRMLEQRSKITKRGTLPAPAHAADDDGVHPVAECAAHVKRAEHCSSDEDARCALRLGGRFPQKSSLTVLPWPKNSRTSSAQKFSTPLLVLASAPVGPNIPRSGLPKHITVTTDEAHLVSTCNLLARERANLSVDQSVPMRVEIWCAFDAVKRLVFKKNRGPQATTDD